MADPKPQESEAPTALDPAVLLIDAKEVVRHLNISGRTWYSVVSIKHAPQPIRLGR
jgi:predicted DNA-binding transcriptional regulator AlpA